MKKYITFIILLFIISLLTAQEEEYLLTDMKIQIECTEAVDSLYNFNFEVAEKQFNWLKQQYPEHPLSYFLLGLSEWWKMQPNSRIEKYDDSFLAYMDTTIAKAERLYDENPKNLEATFFLAGAHGFRARLISDRGNYMRATVDAKRALKYLNENKEELGDEFDPEFQFGHALYNYYREWIPDNKKFLKPIVMFFPGGDKEKGLEQLAKVAKEAFYTRVEASNYLMTIYGAYENKEEEAFEIAEYLNHQFPNNAYFHRNYAKYAYLSGKYIPAEEASRSILERIEAQKSGYEEESGRVASYFIGNIYRRKKDTATAKEYLKKCIAFGDEVGAQEKGYYLLSMQYLAEFAHEEGDKESAMQYYLKIHEYASRDHSAWQEARDYMRGKRKLKRRVRREMD